MKICRMTFSREKCHSFASSPCNVTVDYFHFHPVSLSTEVADPQTRWSSRLLPYIGQPMLMRHNSQWNAVAQYVLHGQQSECHGAAAMCGYNFMNSEQPKRLVVSWKQLKHSVWMIWCRQRLPLLWRVELKVPVIMHGFQPPNSQIAQKWKTLHLSFKEHSSVPQCVVTPVVYTPSLQNPPCARIRHCWQNPAILPSSVFQSSRPNLRP